MDAEEECSLSWQALGSLPRVWGGHRLFGYFPVLFPPTPQLVDIHHPKVLILCGSRLEMGRGTRLILAFLFCATGTVGISLLILNLDVGIKGRMWLMLNTCL